MQPERIFSIIPVCFDFPSIQSEYDMVEKLNDDNLSFQDVEMIGEGRFIIYVATYGDEQVIRQFYAKHLSATQYPSLDQIPR